MDRRGRRGVGRWTGGVDGEWGQEGRRGGGRVNRRGRRGVGRVDRRGRRGVGRWTGGVDGEWGGWTRG